MSTYIDAIPQQVEADGRIHCRFNQYGTDTGRYSSSNPNLQNIPAKNTDIRPMFTVPEGYCLVGSDFSQQEVRIMAFMAKDENLIKAYQEGKDIYAWVASMIYHLPYEECKEFRPDGSTNKEGKKRRENAKAIVLGINYSKGPKSIAEDLGITEKEAQQIYDTFLHAFPKVRDFIQETQKKVYKYGYSETLFGKRRYIPDMQLEEIEVTRIKPNQAELDPTDFLSDVKLDYSISPQEKQYWINRMKKAFGYQQRTKVLEDAKAEGIEIKDNTLKKQDAERQCVNARVQGGAASMSKRAMIAVHNDEELKDLGFKLLIAVHDELIGECPIENQEEVKKRLSYLMIESAKPECIVPMKCDADSFPSWYWDVYESNLKEEYTIDY